MAKLSDFQFTSAEVADTIPFLSGTENYYVAANIQVDVEAEVKRIKEELARAEQLKATASKKLSNERFVNNAPAPVVEKEKAKLADAEARIKILQEQLKKFEA